VAEGESAPRAWRTPVTVQAPGGAAVRTRVTGETSEPPVPFTPGVVVNAGQAGYFRTAYSPGLWAALVARLPGLAPVDQLGLLYDSRALGDAGVAPMSDFFEAARRLPADADPVVVQALAGQLLALDDLHDELPGQAVFRGYALSRLGPIAARLGWTPRGIA